MKNLKQVGNVKKKVGSLLLAAAMIIVSLPVFSTDVHAAENTLPDVTQFATADELKSFNTDDTDGTISAAKVYFGNNNQQWWIAGSQGENTLTLFAASPLATSQQFEPDKDQSKVYSADWKCDYTSTGNTPPADVTPNHYGASPLRTTLKNLESSYFTDAEQGLMNDTTIYTDTNDRYLIYSTTDKLYLAYSDTRFSDAQYVTVGKNGSESDSLNNGLHVDISYWGNRNSYFWLRTPSNFENHTRTQIALPGRGVRTAAVDFYEALVPAFELNLSSVNFASSAPAASSDGKLSENDAFTLRHKSQASIGTATVSQSNQSAEVTGVTNENTYLVVQNKEGAWSKKVSSNDLVFAGDIDPSLTSFEKCKVWLETTSNNITYAKEATQGNGYNVRVNVGENLTVSSGNTAQTGVSGNITDITIKVNDGHYLSDDYIDSIQGLNGLTAAKTDNGFTITGTPTSDVNIILPAAKEKSNRTAPVITGGIGKINGTDITMEYAASETAVSWTSCTDGSTETGAGKWYVRYKETDTQKPSSAKEVTVEAPKYTIAVNNTTLDFGTQNEEYPSVAGQTVSIKNTGNTDVKNIKVSLIGDDADAFTLDTKGMLTTLSANGETSFSVTPNAGLSAGTYTAQAKITGDVGVAKTVDILFTVNDNKYEDIMKTGDETNILLWKMLLISSCVLLICILYGNKKNINQ